MLYELYRLISYIIIISIIMITIIINLTIIISLPPAAEAASMEFEHSC